MSSIVYECIHLLKARLSHKIIIWLILSILVIGVLTVFAAVTQRKDALISQVKEVGLASLVPITYITRQITTVNIDTLLAASQEAIDDFPVLGGTIYDAQTGIKLGEFGQEYPKLSFNQLVHEQKMVTEQESADSSRYDVAWSIHQFGQTYSICQAFLQGQRICQGDDCPDALGTYLILRFDISHVKTELANYTWHIIHLFLIISVVIIIVALFALGYLVLNPILQLHQALLKLSKQQNHESLISLNMIKRNDELGGVIRAFQHMSQELQTHIHTIQQREQNLALANQKAESLLLNILPSPVAQQLKQGVSPIAEHYDDVTVLFADIVGFTELSTKISPTELVGLLNQIFTLFDHLAEQYQVEKIKTIGDAYMVVAGVPNPRDDHAVAIADMALAMQQAVQSFNQTSPYPIQLRIGIHSGAVVAGVIGIRKFIYDLWGDTVNIASRMESHGVTNHIQLTATTYQHLEGHFECSPRGNIKVKGKGMMSTYLLQKKITEQSVMLLSS